MVIDGRCLWLGGWDGYLILDNKPGGRARPSSPYSPHVHTPPKYEHTDHIRFFHAPRGRHLLDPDARGPRQLHLHGFIHSCWVDGSGCVAERRVVGPFWGPLLFVCVALGWSLVRTSFTFPVDPGPTTNPEPNRPPNPFPIFYHRLSSNERTHIHTYHAVEREGVAPGLVRLGERRRELRHARRQLVELACRHLSIFG